MNSTQHVIFGTGPVGMAIMDELCQQGHHVRMVNRSGRTIEPLPESVELVTGDASDTTFTAQVSEGASHIYNALSPPYSKWVAEFPGLQASLINAAEANTARLVVMDNLYMYGDTDGEPIHEGMPYTAHTRKGKLRGQMARDLMAAHDAGRVQVVVGRASDFIGPRVTLSAMGDRVFEKAIAGRAAQVFGNPDSPHSYTYMPDVGRALVQLALTDDAYGQPWHIPTPPAVPTRDLLAMIYSEAGHPLKVQPLPSLMLRLVGLFDKNAGELPEMMYEFNKPFIIDASKYRSRFGWDATPLDDLVKATVAWYQQRATAS
jgi:nucleoside-diphosphate-sugar epimerase